MTLSTEEQKRARLKALRLLERMDRTEKGLKNRMVQCGFSTEAVQDAIDYVKGFGYIDDERYASHYISGRIRTKSRQQIMRELMRKGLDRDTADRIWKELAETEEPHEPEMIREQILKKYDENTVLNEKEMRRLYSFLTRRGFCMNDISKVLEEMKITVQYEKHKTIY